MQFADKTTLGQSAVLGILYVSSLHVVSHPSPCIHNRKHVVVCALCAYVARTLEALEAWVRLSGQHPVRLRINCFA